MPCHSPSDKRSTPSDERRTMLTRGLPVILQVDKKAQKRLARLCKAHDTVMEGEQTSLPIIEGPLRESLSITSCMSDSRKAHRLTESMGASSQSLSNEGSLSYGKAAHSQSDGRHAIVSHYTHEDIRCIIQIKQWKAYNPVQLLNIGLKQMCSMQS